MTDYLEFLRSIAEGRIAGCPTRADVWFAQVVKSWRTMLPFEQETMLPFEQEMMISSQKMDWISIIHVVIERLLGWPVITLTILLSFRRPLMSLLNRIQSFTAGKEGVTVDASIAVSIQKTTIVRDTDAAQRLSVVKNVAVSPSVLAREARIRTDMEALELQPNQETIDILVRHLAVAQALTAAETIYRTIFGSQIALLRSMQATPGTVARQVIEAVYSAAAGRFADLYATYSFQQWLNYLLANGLIETRDQLQFSISVDGTEFLKWLTVSRLREDKPF